LLEALLFFVAACAAEEIRYSYDKNGRLTRVDYSSGIAPEQPAPQAETAREKAEPVAVWNPIQETRLAAAQGFIGSRKALGSRRRATSARRSSTTRATASAGPDPEPGCRARWKGSAGRLRP
jgi:hypothetical protein